MSFQQATVEKLAFGGSGVCRIDGKVCFVPYSCPGDRLSISYTERKKKYDTGEIDKLILPSPARVAPRCSIFGVCGGCNWQHIDYLTQLESKRQILADTLSRVGRVDDSVVSETVAATASYGYRGRSQFKVSIEGGRRSIGFFRGGTHDVVDAPDGCPVALPEINRVLAGFRLLLSLYPDAESVAGLAVDASHAGVLAVIQHTAPVSKAARAFLLKNACRLAPCTALFIKSSDSPASELLWGNGDISYPMPRGGSDATPLHLAYSPGGFAQINQEQNRAILDTIRRLGDFSGSGKLLDLYSGNGNFSLPLASAFSMVTGVEVSAASVEHAEKNKTINHVANVRFFCDDVAARVTAMARNSVKYDTVLLDPPRAGALSAIPGIVRLSPLKIIYVSCDPGTLARDVALLSASGYTLAASVPVDMFPQTYHIESVSLLVKGEGFHRTVNMNAEKSVNGVSS